MISPLILKLMLELPAEQFAVAVVLHQDLKVNVQVEAVLSVTVVRGVSVAPSTPVALRATKVTVLIPATGAVKSC